jgi:hypothetical protein
VQIYFPVITFPFIADMAEDGCCSGCSELDDQVRASTLQTMRIFGVILIIVSVVEFWIGATAHGYMSSSTIYLGSWWTGLAALLTGICGVVNKTRGVVILMITMGAIATAVAVAGVVIDAIAAAEFSNITYCGQLQPTPGVIYSGDGGTAEYLKLYNACFFNYVSTSYDSCFCISSSTSGCQEYAINSKYDCTAFMTTLPKYVKTSAALCSVLAFCSLVLVSIGFSIICCSPSIAKPEKKDPTGLVDNFVVGVNSNDKAF